MGWTSYYTDRTNKEECEHYVQGYVKENLSTVKKTVMHGNNFYALMHSIKGDCDWVLCLLTQRNNGMFFYKDIQCNPYEVGNIPSSILNNFVPGTEEDKEWLKKNLEWHEKEKLKIKPDNFDVLHMKNTYSYALEWNNGFKIEPEQDFYVFVKNINNRKNYILCKKVKTEIDLNSKDGKKLLDADGKVLDVSHINDDNYIFEKQFMRLSNSSIKGLTILNKEDPVRNCHNSIECLDLFEHLFKTQAKKHKSDGRAALQNVLNDFKKVPYINNMLLAGFVKYKNLNTKEAFNQYLEKTFGCTVNKEQLCNKENSKNNEFEQTLGF